MDNLSSERAIRVAACLLVGFSCIQACKWIMLSDGTSFTPSMLYLSRFSGVGAMGLLAILFFHRLPNSRRLFACAVGFVLAYAALSVLAAILAPGTIRIVVLHVAVVLYGIADGIFILLFLQLIALFEPRKSAAILVAIELLTNVFMLFLGMISGTALILVRFGLLAVGIALYFVAAKGLPDEALLDVHDAFKGAEPQSADPAEPHNADGVSSSGAFPHTLSQWALFVVFAAVLFNIFGLVAQISSLSGNSFALYDLPIGIALVLLDVLLLAFLIIRGGEIRFKPVAVLCGSLYVLSLVIYNYAWSAGNITAGILLRGGYDFAWILLTAMVARKVYEQPRKSFAYFGSFRALTTLYPGRLVGTLLLSQWPNQDVVVATTTQVLILVIFAMVVLVFTVQDTATSKPTGETADSTRRDSSGPLSGDASAFGNPNETVNAQSADSATSASRNPLDVWADTFDLTEREREILMDLAKGYTRNVIAQRQYVSPDTVKSHVSHIYAKAGVSSKQELLQLIAGNPPERPTH